MKKYPLGFLIFTLLLFVFPSLTYAAFNNGYPTVGIEVSPQGPVYMQTVKIEVTGGDNPRPKVVWVQTDSDLWNATFEGGTQAQTGTYSGNTNNGADALPREKRTDFDLDMTPYAPDGLQDSLGNSFNRNFVKELMITDMDWTEAFSYTGVGDKPTYQQGTTTANIKVITGYPLIRSNKWQYADRYDGKPKFMVEYYIPMKVFFKGYIIEKKQIRVRENATLAIGETKDMTAEVRTLEYNMSNWNDNWFNVSSNSETTWSSSNTSVATVNSTGKVTAITNGTTTISGEWKKGPYWLKATAVITVGGGSGGGNTEPTEPGSVECSDPSPGQRMQGQDFTPNTSAIIKADNRGNEKFNVLDGIPTTESLFGNAWTKSYLHNYEYQEMVGRCTYKVNVTILPPPPDPNDPIPPPPPPGEEAPEPGTKVQVEVEKEYSFWKIRDVKVYKINEAALWNYAFNGGGIRIQPTGYNAPTYTTLTTSGYSPDPVPEDLKVAFDQDPQEAAENAVRVTVRNDTFTFYDQTLMNGSAASNKASTPSPIPNASMISDDVLYSSGHEIPTSKTNKSVQPSTGAIYYSQVNGTGTLNYPIYGINSITVHTPVVIYPAVSDDKAHNQKTKPAAGRAAIILDRPFTVDMPNSGQHTNYLGYGNRDYLKYIGNKQVRFPFDVYNGAETIFYPRNTWIDVEKSQETFTFFLPVWVDEGFYDVEFRTIAHNAPSGWTQETNANLNLTNHVAYDTVPVDAIGRVYDFRITDIADFNWETVFRTSKGSAIPTETSYWVGLGDIDGASRGNTQRYTLPIRPGSHPVFKNVVIKTGYHFKFDLKTKGNMFGKDDQIVIKPSFYFINAKDGSRTSVDLYYLTRDKSYVKIGSSRDTVERYVILNERLRNVPLEELTDTALYNYDHYYSFDQIATVGRPQFVSRYINNTSKLKTPVGSLSLLQLTESIRTFIGPKMGIPVSVDPARVNASVQKWYGEYSLPSDLYAVKTGVNVAEYGRTHNGLSDKSPIFLKCGYIVVNFNIETVRNGEVKKPYLQYINAELMNQWQQMEGFSRSVKDSYGVNLSLMDGDVVLYNADSSSRDDFRSMVTH